jgi:hypothetical protein
MDCSVTVLRDEPQEYRSRHIISTSLFRMKSGGYKSFSKYLAGVRVLDDYAGKHGMVVWMHVDASIGPDILATLGRRRLPHTRILRFECKAFKVDDVHHVSVFGTLVRFFPIFDESLVGRRVYILDVDVTPQSLTDTIRKLDTGVEAVQADAGVAVVFGSSFWHINQWEHSTIYRPVPGITIRFVYVLAQQIAMLRPLPRQILDDFLKDVLLPYMSEDPRDVPSAVLSPYKIAPHERQARCERNICFGVDEFFCNGYVIQRLIDLSVPFCVLDEFSLNDYRYYFSPDIAFEKYRIPRHLRSTYKAVYRGYVKQLGFSDRQMEDAMFLQPPLWSLRESRSLGPGPTAMAQNLLSLLWRLYRKRDFRVFRHHYLSQLFSRQDLLDSYETLSLLRLEGGSIRSTVLHRTQYPHPLSLPGWRPPRSQAESILQTPNVGGASHSGTHPGLLLQGVVTL